MVQAKDMLVCKSILHESSISYHFDNFIYCPFTIVFCLCAINKLGYCTPLCCEDYVEETCYSQSTGQAESCAKIVDGGCPCPEGQIKCGAFGGYPG